MKPETYEFIKKKMFEYKETGDNEAEYPFVYTDFIYTLAEIIRLEKEQEK